MAWEAFPALTEGHRTAPAAGRLKAMALTLHSPISGGPAEEGLVADVRPDPPPPGPFRFSKTRGQGPPSCPSEASWQRAAPKPGKKNFPVEANHRRACQELSEAKDNELSRRSFCKLSPGFSSGRQSSAIGTRARTFIGKWQASKLFDGKASPGRIIKKTQVLNGEPCI